MGSEKREGERARFGMGAEERLLLAIDGLVAVCRTSGSREAAGSCDAVAED
jgi:hypothetical protein